MIARAVIPIGDLGTGGRATELNHVPLICGGGTAAGGPNRGDEVGPLKVAYASKNITTCLDCPVLGSPSEVSDFRRRKPFEICVNGFLTWSYTATQK